MTRTGIAIGLLAWMLILAGCGGDHLPPPRKVGIYDVDDDDDDARPAKRPAKPAAAAKPATPQVAGGPSAPAPPTASTNHGPKPPVAPATAAPSGPAAVNGAIADVNLTIALARPETPLDAVAQRRFTIENLKRLAEAMDVYMREHGALPAKALLDSQRRPTLSWRVALLPYLGYQELHGRFRLEEAWNSAHNLPLLAEMPREYVSPTRWDARTNILAPVSDESGYASILGVKTSRFENGIAHSILLVEADDRRAAVWTQPHEYEYEPANPFDGLGGLHEDGIFVVLGERKVRRIPPDVGPETLRALLAKKAAGFRRDEVLQELTVAVDPRYAKSAPAAVAAGGIIGPDGSVSAGSPTAGAPAEASRPTPATSAADSPIDLAQAHVAAWQYFQPKPAIADKRRPIPLLEARNSALNTLKSIHAELYQNRDSANGLQALARGLFKQLDEVTEDAVGRFVLLDQVRCIAPMTGDGELALQAINQMNAEYQVDPWQLKRILLNDLDRASGANSRGDKMILQLASELILQGVKQDQYDSLDHVWELALATARRSNSNDMVRQITALRRDVDSAAAAYARVVGKLPALRNSADDDEANLTVGRYLCLTKGEWDLGLPLLARARDWKLKGLAVLDLRRPRDATDQVALGDGWWELSGRTADHEQAQLRIRAAQWYQQALPSMPASLQRSKVARIVEQVKEHYGEAELTPLELSDREIARGDGPTK